jgi:fatty-acyl-CoA synthase
VTIAGTEVAGRFVPPPGAAELPFPTVSAMLRRNGTLGDAPAVKFEDEVWSHARLWHEVRRWADWMASLRPLDGSPFHVGVLLDNSPDYLCALGAAALTGATLVGVNPTRVGPELARDLDHADLVAVVTEDRHRPLLADIGVVPAEPELPAEPSPWDDPSADPDVSTRWLLVFTSGTSSAPKAVICSQRRLLTTGERMRILLDVGPSDTGYLCMPLFHSNALMVGMMPALIAGASLAVTRRFSASGWLADVRRHQVTYWNYTGKPLAYLLATPERPDDRDNLLTRAYGNEGNSTVVDAFTARFGVAVIDGFGPTEGGIGIMRTPTDPPGSLGHGQDKVWVVDADGNRLPRAVFGADGLLANAEDCVGEIVNTAGPGPFEGYWRNEEATARAVRGGWYWTGDLGYVDDDGFVYFAGRASDWIRVDGENFPAGPIEVAVTSHPDVVGGAVYGIPAGDSGDAVMTALVLRDGAALDPAEFATWIDNHPGMGPKWRPIYVRITTDLPRTPTHKVLHRVLQQHKVRRDRVGGDVLWHRPRGAAAYEIFTALDEAALHQQFLDAGRNQFWEL